MAGVPRSRAGILGAAAAIAAVVVIGAVLVSRAGIQDTDPVPSPSGAAPAPSPGPTEPATATASQTTASSPGPTAGEPVIEGLVRVDQLGFVPDETKAAFLLATAPATGAALRSSPTLGRWC